MIENAINYFGGTGDFIKWILFVLFSVVSASGMLFNNYRYKKTNNREYKNVMIAYSIIFEVAFSCAVFIAWKSPVKDSIISHFFMSKTGYKEGHDGLMIWLVIAVLMINILFSAIRHAINPGPVYQADKTVGSVMLVVVFFIYSAAFCFR